MAATARKSHDYRGARRNRAKLFGLIWRDLPRQTFTVTDLVRRRMTIVKQIAVPHNFPAA